ncbi:MAG TPA: type IV toxin-antitoxin system AbiEi family antitoxin domain-containing protein [Solirubrobacteraceae bacterium]|jgi:hypothetical protein|nr:type IV toxin-antitoxin system AbiEi family antitoxin domain-containing protein [Solirubrobacteraceae bacterium]
MRPQRSAVERAACRRHQVVTRAQLLGLGIRPARIAHWVRIGLLRPAYRGVYIYGGVSTDPLTAPTATVLACGEEAHLSGVCTLVLFEIEARWPPRFEVTAPVERERRGIVVHRSRTLTAADVTVYRDVPTTRVARALRDAAGQLGAKRPRRAYNQARVKGVLGPGAVRWLQAQAHGVPGAEALRAIVDPTRGPTRSELEERFIEFCLRYGIPLPEVNETVLGVEVDMLWRSAGLIVELDGWWYHRDRVDLDHTRDLALRAAGFEVQRVTWGMLETDPAGLGRSLKAMIDRRTARP